jgi:hypothetical protein
MGTMVRVYRPGSGIQRTEVAADDVEKIPLSPHTISFQSGNGKEVISVGDNFPTRAGGILILRVQWETGGAAVFFYENGKFYRQLALYFWQDSWMEAFRTGARWATGGMLLAQIQVEICLGIMAGYGGAVPHWALTAVDVLHAVSEMDVRALIDGIPKLIRARRALKTYAPRLYDKLFSMFVDKLIENISESLASAALAHFVGRTLGRMGRHVPGKMLETIKDIARWAAAFIAIRLVAIVGLAAKDLKQMATNLKNELTKMNIQVSEADAEVIIREMLTHKKEILNSMQLMQGQEPQAQPQTEPKTNEPQKRERIWTGFKQ